MRDEAMSRSMPASGEQSSLYASPRAACLPRICPLGVRTGNRRFPPQATSHLLKHSHLSRFRNGMR
jgi:hypothetical protein